MKKVKLIRDYNGKKKGEVIEVTEQVSYFMLMNSIAVLSDCQDCEEWEDCKSKKKKTKTKPSIDKGALS